MACRAVFLIILLGVISKAQTEYESKLQIHDFSPSFLSHYHEYSGLHLSDGTHQKWIYNINRLDCARRCTYSANEEPERIPCRSFEFYPMEEPRTDPPWNENSNSGVCVLNSGTSMSGLLRYEDEGLTDANLVYTSHFTKRSGSSHYSAIDFGGSDVPAIYGHAHSRIPWTGSRQGAVIYDRPSVNLRHFICLNMPNNTNTTSETVQVFYNNANDGFYHAGFAPLNVTTGKCPVAGTKERATSICTNNGARLCTQKELRVLFAENVGCGIDAEDGDGNFPVWAAEDIISAKNPVDKYVKCCARFKEAFSCDSYKQENIDFCKSLTSETQCINQGSGFSKQEKYGFGRYLNELRWGCVKDQYSCGVTPVSGWEPRDRCIWCGGDCRPGSSYGVCNKDMGESATSFAEKFALKCPPSSACALANAYEDLMPLIVDPYSVIEREDATPAPTKVKRCNVYKTARECSKYYNDCYWGKWYGKPACLHINQKSTR